MTPTPKRGRGQPRKEATTQIRIYSADKPKLKGKTQAEAVRRLLTPEPASGPRIDPQPSTSSH